MYDVAALGELLIDFTCRSTDKDGYPVMEAHPGGAPANFLAAVTKLGGSAAMLGKVGDDAFGRLLTGTLRACGIETRGIVADPGVFTTLAFVTLDARGEREFSFARRPGADTCLRADELDLSLVDEAKAFHFGSLSLTDEPARGATRRAVAYARERRKLVTFDPNLRRPLWRDLNEAKTQMLWGIAQADVVKLSDEEADFLFSLPPQEAAAHVVAHCGVKLAFVTCGADGCCFASSRASGRASAPRGIAVVDTTGAGDIFGGCAVKRLLDTGKRPEELSGDELRAIAEFACDAAGRSTTYTGGISSLRELSL